MRKGFLAIAGLLFLLSARAAEPVVPILSVESSYVAPSLCSENCAATVWGQADYLLFWVKNGPLPIPLVTTSSAADFGTLGAPTTHTLFGGSDLDYGTFAGMRLTLGGWLDADQTVGVEGGGFALERRSVAFATRTDAGGSPLLAIPVFDPRTGGPGLPFVIQPAGFPLPGEAGLFLTHPDTFAGGLALQSSTRLWGAEAMVVGNLGRTDQGEWSVLAGFRYLDLTEEIALESDSMGLAGSGSFAGSHFHTHDLFGTRNQFYGGQLGVRVRRQYGRLSGAVVGKLALGSMHETSQRYGGTTVQNSRDASIPSGSYPGGLLALPTNAGRQTRDAFAVAPEVQVQAAYTVSRFLRVLAGYDFLYASEVVRPGDQIDRVVNPSQLPAFGGFSLSGPARPAPLFRTADFWAQGIQLGVEIRY